MKNKVLEKPVIHLTEKEANFTSAFICEIWNYMGKKHRFDPKIRRKVSKVLRLVDTTSEQPTKC